MATDKLKMELVRTVDGNTAHLRASGTLLADTPRPLADPTKQTFSEPSARVAVNADGSLSFELVAELVAIKEPEEAPAGEESGDGQAAPGEN